MKKITLLLAVLSLASGLSAQTVIKQSGWEWRISDKGTIEQLFFKTVGGMIRFLSLLGRKMTVLPFI